MNYPVVLHQDPDSDYGVTVPDPGSIERQRQNSDYCEGTWAIVAIDQAGPTGGVDSMA